MKCLIILAAVCVGASVAQFENGFVKILEDKRYQEGAAFGNFRRQEDGITYQEETDSMGVRRGFWEYPDETGKINRVEFESGPNIGFRIVNSNFIAANLQDTARTPVAPRTAPAPVRPVAAPIPVQRAPVQQTIPQAPVKPVLRAPVQVPSLTPTTTPGPLHLFDYPANLEFSRHAGGHSFKFSAA